MGAALDETMECGFYLGGNATGVWYKMTGTGGLVEVTVNATFDVEFAIYEGDCDEMVCLEGAADDFDNFNFVALAGATNEGQVYHMYITGWEGAVGDFVVSVSERSVPENSECGGAIDFVIGGTAMEGSTEFARIPQEEAVPVCSMYVL